MTTETMAWTAVCSVDDVPDEEGRRFDVEGHALAIFNVDGEFFASDDVCTHGQSSLSEGYVESGCVIECIAHMARFSLRSGQVLAPPATTPLRVYPTTVDGNKVMVQING